MVSLPQASAWRDGFVVCHRLSFVLLLDPYSCAPLLSAPSAARELYEVSHMSNAPPTMPSSAARTTAPGIWPCEMVERAEPDAETLAAAEEATADPCDAPPALDIDINVEVDDTEVDSADDVTLADREVDAAEPEGRVTVTFGRLIGLFGAEAHCSIYAARQTMPQGFAETHRCARRKTKLTVNQSLIRCERVRIGVQLECALHTRCLVVSGPSKTQTA